ncbi:MAG: hypothetical protein AAF224_05110 [Pseudomonadota bacterium]
MSKLLAPIIFVVAAAGGGGAGFFAKQMLAGGEAEVEAEGEGHGEGQGEDGAHGDDHADAGHAEDHHGDDGHGDDDHGDGHGDDHADGHGDSHGDGHGDGHDDDHGDGPKKKAYADDGHGGDELVDGVGYFKFSRQFVVPIIGEGGVGSLVILDLNLEMSREAAEAFYFREPKFRDALMQELLDLANQGRFQGRLTDRRNLDAIRVNLLAAVQDIAGDAVKEVLILDIMRQDL